MPSPALCVSDVEKVTVDVENIYLDIRNPRFFGEADLSLVSTEDRFNLINQEVIRQYILKKYSASEIVESILEVGFIPIDLIVVEEVDNRYIVVEGNRRITAIKTILGDYQRKAIDVDNDILSTITKFEVLKIKTKTNRELKKWILQGIRHVSGVRGWGPYQQAKLIHELHYNNKMKFVDISKSIGIHYNRVSTMLKAYLALNQMQNNAAYKDKASVNLFSHFEQAYIKKEIREWLGWNDATRSYENNEHLLKFYDLILTKDSNFTLMSKHIRDDLPGLIKRDTIFNKVMEKKISIHEAKQMITATHTKNTITSQLISCRDLIISAVENGQISKEHLEIVKEICEVVHHQ